MYIIRNALKCISRSIGRNVLIGIIVLVIAVASCLGLSIRQASETAKEETLAGISVTATISYDRSSMMNNMMGGPGGGRPDMSGGFDKDMFSSMMGEASSLTLEEQLVYAKAESVSDFYYTLTAYFNGSEELEPVSSSGSSSNDDTDSDSADASKDGGSSFFPGGPQGMMGMGGFSMAQSGDFTVVGYSDESAMTSFINGTASITDGEVFEEGTASLNCIVSEELALYNEISVGDGITLINPNDEEEVYTLKVVGIYTDDSANESAFGMMGAMTMSDPVNKIYMSADALQTIVDASEAASETVADENTGREFETKLTSSLSGTYVFATAEDYEAFEAEARALGLDDAYTISSQDLTAYEQSLTPLNTLSTMAGYFLLVILGIGAVILIVLNIFNVRERKYEIGVLTAMGMKKGKVALQFVTEIFTITLAAVIVGAVIGAACSVPVTNALLANQIESQSNRSDALEENFGRGERPDDMGGGNMPSAPGGFGGFGGFEGFEGGFGGMFEDAFNAGANYVSTVNSAVNLTVLLQMLGIAVLLTLISGAASMLFIMRYEPLKILANRD